MIYVLINLMSIALCLILLHKLRSNFCDTKLDVASSYFPVENAIETTESVTVVKILL